MLKPRKMKLLLLAMFSLVFATTKGQEAIPLESPRLISMRVAEYDINVEKPGLYRFFIKGKIPYEYLSVRLDGDQIFGLEWEAWEQRKHIEKQVTENGKTRKKYWLYENVYLSEGEHVLRVGMKMQGYGEKIPGKPGGWKQFGFEKLGLALEPMPKDIPPQETLAVREMDCEDMVFELNAPLKLDIHQRTNDAVDFDVVVKPQRPEGGYEAWKKSIHLAANQACAKAEVVYPCDKEGIFEYSLVDKKGQTIFGPWAFCVIDSTPLPLPKVGEEKQQALTLVDKINCSEVHDLTHSFRDNGTSFVMEGPDTSYRVTGPMQPKRMEYVQDKSRPGYFIRLAKAGEKARYGFYAFDWYAYSMRVDQPGKPHFLRVKVPTDVKRKITVSVIDPITLGINTGVFHVGPGLGCPPIATFELVCWPNGSWVDVLVTNLKSHQDVDNTQGAIVSFELYRAGDGLPALPEAVGGWDKKREFGYAIEQRDLGVERFTMAKWWNGVEMPKQTLDSNSVNPVDGWGRTGGRDLKSMVQSWKRLAEYSQFLGDNYVKYGSCTYLMHMFRIPHYPAGQAVYTTGWKRSYKDRYPREPMKLAMMLASKYNTKIVVDTQLNAFGNLPDFVMQTESDFLGGKTGQFKKKEVFLVNLNGKLQTEWWNYAVCNPAHPLAINYMKLLFGEIAKKFGKYPAFAGVNMRAWPIGSFSGYYINDSNGYDQFSVDRFCKERGFKMPKFSDDDPDCYRERKAWLEKNAWKEWLDWRGEKVVELRKAIAAEVKKYAPQARLHVSSVSLSEEGKDGLFKDKLEGRRELGHPDKAQLGETGVEMSYPDPTCFENFDIRPGVEKITPKNMKWAQCGYLPGICTGNTGAVRNYPQDLRKAVDALAKGNVDLFLVPSSWIPPTITKNRRDFVQAWRSIPYLKYKKLETKSPVTCWFAPKAGEGEKCVVYLVNQSFFPQTVTLAFDGEAPICTDRVTGKKVDATKKGIAVKPCMIRVLTVAAATQVKEMASKYSPGYLKKLGQYIDTLKHIIATSNGMTHVFPNVGEEFALEAITKKKCDHGEWNKSDLTLTAQETFASALKAWKEKNYLVVERELERIDEHFVWWYEAFGWPKGHYIHTMPKGPYATPEKLLKANVSTDGEVNSYKGTPGKAFVVPSGKATLICENDVPCAIDLMVYMLTGKDVGPVDVFLNDKKVGKIGFAEGTDYFGRFTLPRSMPAFKGSKITLQAPAGRPLVLKAVEMKPLYPTIIKKWQGVGLFDKGPGTRPGRATPGGMEKVFPPETETNFSASRVYKGLDGKKVSWKKIDIGKDKFLQMVEKYFPYQFGNFNGLAYVTCWIYSPTKRPATLYLAADWFYKVWVNGKLEIPEGSGPWGYFKPFPITLDKGWNRLLVKSARGNSSWTLNVAITDPGDLKFSDQSPE